MTVITFFGITLDPTSFKGPVMVPSRNHLKLVIGQILSLNLVSGDTIKQDCSSHGFEVSKWVVDGVLPPRLLQDHSPSGEAHGTAMVQNPRSSGEQLVNGSDPCA